MKSNKLCKNFPLKCLAVFISAVAFIAATVSALALIYLVNNSYFQHSEEYKIKSVFSGYVERKNSNLGDYIASGMGEDEFFGGDTGNYIYEVYNDLSGELMYSNKNSVKSKYKTVSTYTFHSGTGFDLYYKDGMYYDENGSEYDADMINSMTASGMLELKDSEDGLSELKAVEGQTLRIFGSVDPSLSSADEFQNAANTIRFCYRYKVMPCVILPISVIILIIMMIFSYSSAGYKNGYDGVVLGFGDRIPFDVLTLIAAAAVYGIYSFIKYTYDYCTYKSVFLPSLTVGVTAAYLLFLFWSISLARRAKSGNVIKNAAIYRIATSMAAVPYAVTVYIIFAVCIIGTGFITSLTFGNAKLYFAVTMILLAALFILVIRYSASVKSLNRAAEEYNEGNFEYKIKTEHIFAPLKGFADKMNHIGGGMKSAVDDMTKAERLKAELITNVSHDIKTPLTSIINYVDLLGAENIENEKAREYTKVLARQSKRLKKLIDDLLEASKISTGNIPVHMERCDLGVFITQLSGEYREKFEKASLQLVADAPASEPYIMADGRLLWRVFDNLMNNAYKYAMPATRVYLSLNTDGDKVCVTLKNVSKNPLNLTSDELFERFTRGDRSRSTEGNGLGLSIAESLVKLQNGDISINIDGDLFKVAITFDICKEVKSK